MPGFNGSGPLGKGMMTGRGRGRCVMKWEDVPTDQKSALKYGKVAGRGLGTGAGFGGRGLGPMFRNCIDKLCQIGGQGLGRRNGRKGRQFF
ncbi:DUF5320 domain-containing protein [Heliobacterium chlorum]|uniref:DUF5320 domain-containing protein n=1 Tax=Heliobacterium chlorum TaxID=2698 RepID=A0ABR7SYU7_HELCL|nr:DUF5320 domain-containing protein [Heliobacterium chlorum]MBC9783708.1 DUF5320 domain-containing protein [Heliobacterium chlorum]